ncbi:hypothetical protein F66182_14665, partial [Fusarium sp. NRRL 66182]
MESSLQAGLTLPTHKSTNADFVPYWARCRVQYAQNLLEYSSEPIEYDYRDDDGWENCFFFPEDCTRAPVIDRYETDSVQSIDSSDKASFTLSDVDVDSADNMTPALPDIRMLDTEALSDLLEDNLSPPEITSIL